MNDLKKILLMQKYLLFAKKIARSDTENAISQILFCCASLDFIFDTASKTLKCHCEYDEAIANYAGSILCFLAIINVVFVFNGINELPLVGCPRYAMTFLLRLQ